MQKLRNSEQVGLNTSVNNILTGRGGATKSPKLDQKNNSNKSQSSGEDRSVSSAQSANEVQYADYFQDVVKPRIEEVIHEWSAPSRPFKKGNRQYHTTVITIALLLSFILFFAGQVLTIAVIVAVVFLGYVMSTIPPHTIKNKLTTYGIRSEESLYYWEELGRFWYGEKNSEKILYVEVARFPHRLTLLLGKTKKNLLTEILSEVLLNKKPPLTAAEKFAEWLKKKVPLDLDS